MLVRWRLSRLGRGRGRLLSVAKSISKLGKVREVVGRGGLGVGG